MKMMLAGFVLAIASVAVMSPAPAEARQMLVQSVSRGQCRELQGSWRTVRGVEGCVLEADDVSASASRSDQSDDSYDAAAGSDAAIDQCDRIINGRHPGLVRGVVNGLVSAGAGYLGGRLIQNQPAYHGVRNIGEANAIQMGIPGAVTGYENGRDVADTRMDACVAEGPALYSRIHSRRRH